MSKIQGDRTNGKYVKTSNKSHAKLITVAWSQVVACSHWGLYLYRSVKPNLNGKECYKTPGKGILKTAISSHCNKLNTLWK